MDEIEFIRQCAKDSRLMLEITLQWKVDCVRTLLGLTEVVDGDPPKHARLFFKCPCTAAPYAHGHFVIDKVFP